MRIKEECHSWGRFQLRVKKDGRLIEEIDEHNLIVNKGKLQVARLLAGDVEGRSIVKVAVGTNGKPPVPTDLVISGAFAKAFDSIEYPAPGQVKFSWSLSTQEANGKVIMEFGLLCSDGSLFARRTRDVALNKTDDITVEGDWTINF